MIWHKDRFEVGTFDEVPSMSANQIKTDLGVESCWGILFFKCGLYFLNCYWIAAHHQRNPATLLFPSYFLKPFFQNSLELIRSGLISAESPSFH
jgi:hypothetical protein